MISNKILLDILKGKKSERTPVWFMRQAGRYLPEYREIRNNISSFLDFCYSSDLAAEVTLQPIRRFNFDAAIIFSDILVIPDALGNKVWFEKGEGPRLEIIDNIGKLQNLKFNEEKLYPVYEAIKIVRKELSNDKALLGFSGAPWTLAAYMIEGAGSRDFSSARKFIYQQPEIFSKLIDILSGSILKHLINQVKHGVDAVQIFDSWAGVLSYDEYVEFVIKPTKKIVDNFKKIYPDVPVIGFPKSSGVKYKEYAEKTGVDAISLDYSIDLNWIKDNIKIPMQGNLDPVLLAASKELSVKKTKEILDNMKNYPFIFNLGHGILPETPIENVEAVLEVIRNHG